MTQPELPDGLLQEAKNAFINAEGLYGGSAPIISVLEVGYRAGRRKAAEVMQVLPGSLVWRLMTGELETNDWPRLGGYASYDPDGRMGSIRAVGRITEIDGPFLTIEVPQPPGAPMTVKALTSEFTRVERDS
jgi:hypothetical protein